MIWSEAYSTGVGRLDDQHRMLFRMAADFRAALDHEQGARTYDDLLRALDVYARAHFRYEEECMNRYRCPVAGRNRDAHAAFVEVLAGFRQGYMTNGFIAAEAARLMATVETWLSDHICHIDVQLKPFVEKE